MQISQISQTFVLTRMAGRYTRYLKIELLATAIIAHPGWLFMPDCFSVLKKLPKKWPFCFLNNLKKKSDLMTLKMKSRSPKSRSSSRSSQGSFHPHLNRLGSVVAEICCYSQMMTKIHEKWPQEFIGILLRKLPSKFEQAGISSCWDVLLAKKCSQTPTPTQSDYNSPPLKKKYWVG